MSVIDLGCQLDYQVEFETSFIFQVTVHDSAHQKILHEAVSCDPAYEIEICHVGELQHRIHRLVAQPGELHLRYTATVSNNPRLVPSGELKLTQHARLPCNVLEYLNPSRYCESDKLEYFAWDTFGNLPFGHARVQAVADWVFNHLTYQGGSTGSTTTACDVFLQRHGVCRDFAHLMIAVCRALGFPARYVAGYAVDLTPPDFHGFVEVFLDDAWYLFDATRLAPVDGFVRIGAGRDAADVSFATYVGNSMMNQMEVWARLSEDSPEADSQARPTLKSGAPDVAVSLS